jgi:hypothetical protein
VGCDHLATGFIGGRFLAETMQILVKSLSKALACTFRFASAFGRSRIKYGQVAPREAFQNLSHPRWWKVNERVALLPFPSINERDTTGARQLVRSLLLGFLNP